MSPSTKVRASVATAFVAIAICGWLLMRATFAPKTVSLAALPEYPFVGSSYSLDDIPPPARDRAEATLRQFAARVSPGYQPTAERFLAIKGDFIWDAVAKSVGGYLSDTGFRVRDAGQTPHSGGPDVAYIVWDRGNPLAHFINPGQVLAVGLQDPLPGGSGGDQGVHVYAYFELTPAPNTTGRT